MDESARSRLNEAMLRLADGDRAAFDEVHDGLAAVVRRYCVRLLGEVEGEDAAQLALLKLFSESHRFEPEGDALRWALTLATWECRTLRKKRARRRESFVELAPEDALSPATPETELVARDLERRALEALEMLSELDRSTLLADTSPRDVSAVSFRKRKERALARLREVWRRVHGA
jgi:RNA polymerase sigma-70 factor (ECF subfamily)